MNKIRKIGPELYQADAFTHVKGLNTSDSPYLLTDEHAILGANYDYFVTGGIRKRFAATAVNSTVTPEAQASPWLGMFVHNTSFGVKTLLAAIGSQLQSVNTTTGATTAVYTDTSTSTSSVFTATQPVVYSQFNTTTVNAAWLAGGGQSSNQLGGYNGSIYTLNGAAAPAAGTLGLTATSTDGTLAAGNYWYGVAFKKASTGATSNVSLDTLVTVSSTNHVLITFSTVTNPDSTKYNQVLIYRSAISPTGVQGFTTGNLVATVNWSTGFYIDTGANQANADIVPRPGNTNLDNSVLPTGTYNCVTTWKRRLVTASGSTLYFSDVNKPESWPTSNTETVPSGGNITALAVIQFSTPTSSSIDEMLCVFKERELWVITGNYFTLLTDTSGAVTQNIDIALKFVDAVGCVGQNLLTVANGFLFWVDYRGFFVWDGAYKPIYLSRPIQFDFGLDGDVDLTNLSTGCCAFLRRQDQVIWVLSSKTSGKQSLGYKVDLRLTLPSMGQALSGRIIDGIFIKDTFTYPIQVMHAAINQSQDTLWGGTVDNNYANPTIAKLYDNSSEDQCAAGTVTAPMFSYRTRPEDFGNIGEVKRFHKIIVWCKEDNSQNLTLNYWSDYHTVSAAPFMNSQARQVCLYPTNAYWDQSLWDNAYWDTNLETYNPVVFNLNGIEGDALTLEFQQQQTQAPLTIAGYSVIFSLAGVRK